MPFTPNSLEFSTQLTELYANNVNAILMFIPVPDIDFN